MAEINLIKIDGKPLEKLIEVISKGMGTVYEPTRIKREGKAEGQKLIELAKAKTLAKHECEELDAAFLERMENRMLVREVSRQINIENISEKAADILRLEDSVSEEPLSQDWINRFFKNAEDVSDEDVQQIWARVLAGEVKKPNSFSLRTLDFLKNLSKSDAELILECFSLVLQRSSLYLYKGETDEILSKNNLSFKKLSLLREIGIVHDHDMIVHRIKQTPEHQVYYMNKTHILIGNLPQNYKTVEVPVYTLTSIAAELYPITEVEPNLNIMKNFAEYLSANGIECVYYKILSVDGDTIHYDTSQAFTFK